MRQLQTEGIHHVTAIAGDPEENIRFYTGVLGLRMVKKTVNHDDVSTYHLYYGDGKGTPGTTITFFPWGGEHEKGNGPITEVSFRIPDGSVDYWKNRLQDRDIDFRTLTRFGEQVIRFEDPDGLQLELVETATLEDYFDWDGNPIPEEHCIRGIGGVTLRSEEVWETEQVLTEILGYEFIDENADRRRYLASDDSVIDVLSKERVVANPKVGGIHHVAFKTQDEQEQRQFKQQLDEQELSPSKIIDRKYFRSLYFNEPGEALFEISTIGPGFTVDEDIEELGTTLTLPQRLENQRKQIKHKLPELNIKEAKQ